jgi:hypothetical protein
MQTPVNWGGFQHQFLSSSVTYKGRSIGETGTGANYHFSHYNTYSDGSGDASGGTGGGVTAIIGSVTNGGNASGYPGFECATDSGYYTYQVTGGSKHTLANYTSPSSSDIGASLTFWASDASGNPTGNVTDVATSDSMRPDNITSFDFSQLTQLQSVAFSWEPALTSVNLSGFPSLRQIAVMNIPALTSIDASNCPSLTIFWCLYDNLGTINITHDYALPAPSSDFSTTFILMGNPGVTITGP